MAGVKFIRVNGRVVPIKDKGGAPQKGARQKSYSKLQVSNLKMNSARVDAKKFKPGTAVLQGAAAGIIGGGLGSGVKGALLFGAVGAAVGSLIKTGDAKKYSKLNREGDRHAKASAGIVTKLKKSGVRGSDISRSQTRSSTAQERTRSRNKSGV